MALYTGDGPTFSLDVSSHGASSLRTAIMKKLSEFIGSSSDDVLAVIVSVLCTLREREIEREETSTRGQNWPMIHNVFTIKLSVLRKGKFEVS